MKFLVKFFSISFYHSPFGTNVSLPLLLWLWIFMPVVFRRMIELKLIQDAEGSFNIVINLATINFFLLSKCKNQYTSFSIHSSENETYWYRNWINSKKFSLKINWQENSSFDRERNSLSVKVERSKYFSFKNQYLKMNETKMNKKKKKKRQPWKLMWWYGVEACKSWIKW